MRWPWGVRKTGAIVKLMVYLELSGTRTNFNSLMRRVVLPDRSECERVLKYTLADEIGADVRSEEVHVEWFALDLGQTPGDSSNW